ncbi:hypothetical protein [Microcoleus anatoxicus]|uniref:hypothetical protein n=1 Tax=Microcoleus anatoxicus TaxID=2705319 RepID=UPI0030C8F1C7
MQYKLNISPSPFISEAEIKGDRLFGISQKVRSLFGYMERAIGLVDGQGRSL